MRAAIAPGVMVPELTAAWQLNAQDLVSLLGFYFLTHASFALVAGASLDRYGAKWTIPAMDCLHRRRHDDVWRGALFFTRKSAGLQGAGSAARKTSAISIGALLNA